MKWNIKSHFKIFSAFGVSLLLNFAYAGESEIKGSFQILVSIPFALKNFLFYFYKELELDKHIILGFQNF